MWFLGQGDTLDRAWSQLMAMGTEVTLLMVLGKREK